MTRSLINRRTLLRGFAGATVLVAGGMVWRAWDTGTFMNGEGIAYEPWHDWRDGNVDGPMGIVLAGILAANAHNTQPWRFEVGQDQIAVFADYDRHLGSFDPFRREMMLSLGCALENMAHAAQAQGFRPQISPTPGHLMLGGPADIDRPVAVIQLRPDERRETELFKAITHRHTHRGAYDHNEPIAEDLQREMLAMVPTGNELTLLVFAQSPETNRFAKLTVQATAQIISDHKMAHDSAQWFRFDRHSINTHRDGVTIDAFGLPPLLNTAVKMLPAPSSEQADRQWLDVTRDVHVATAPLFGMIAVRDLYLRETALAAGRLWQRLHLWATARGLAAQPLNQIPEVVDREAELGKGPRMAEALTELTGDASWRPTFAFRMGWASTQARLSPRRGLAQVVST